MSSDVDKYQEHFDALYERNRELENRLSEMVETKALNAGLQAKLLNAEAATSVARGEASRLREKLLDAEAAISVLRKLRATDQRWEVTKALRKLSAGEWTEADSAKWIKAASEEVGCE